MSNLPVQQKKNFSPSVLWRWDGTIDRVQYLTLGLALAGIKYGIDASIASFIFHRDWSPLNYIVPGKVLDVLAMSINDQMFFGSLLLMSLPFIWAGVVLTLKRLRSIGIPGWPLLLFFIPIVNFVMFGILCILPESGSEADSEPKVRYVDITGRELASEASPAARRQDDSLAREATYAVLITAPVGAILAFAGATFLKTYGWGLFIGIPFAVGMCSAYLFGRQERRTWPQCLLVSVLSTTAVGLTIFIWAWEGIICLLMAAPIAYTLAIMGALLGYFMQNRKHLPTERRLIMIFMLMVLPTMMGCEFAAHPESGVLPVVSTVTINAPPSVVWKHVIAFPELAPPTDPLFALGVAHPLGATITGKGPGAIRHCRFSTGAFIEPIQVWNEPRLLKFGVIAQPECMRETAFFREIHPAHLHGYLNVSGGQFLLRGQKQADGSQATILEGTTWYQNQMWPNCYWRIWSDHIIHTIHMRVLKHVKQLSETRSSDQSY